MAEGLKRDSFWLLGVTALSPSTWSITIEGVGVECTTWIFSLPSLISNLLMGRGSSTGLGSSTGVRSSSSFRFNCSTRSSFWFWFLLGVLPLRSVNLGGGVCLASCTSEHQIYDGRTNIRSPPKDLHRNFTDFVAIGVLLLIEIDDLKEEDRIDGWIMYKWLQ